MWLYLVILGISFIVAINDINDKRTFIMINNHKWFDGKVMLSAFALYLTLFVLTAFRNHTVGNDTHVYIKIFNNIAVNGVGGYSTRIEIGFKYYCYILSKVSKNPQILLIVTAIICYGVTGKFILSNCRLQGVMVALFIPLFFKSFCSGLRQELAFCFCILAYMSIKRNKNYVGGVLIVIAALFHVTALVAMMYFIIPILTKQRKLIIPFVLFLISLYVFIRASGIMEFFNRYGSYYEHYYNEQAQKEIGTLSCILTLFQSLFALYTYCVIKKKTSNIDIVWNDDEILWFGVVMVAISVSNFFINNAARIMWYFELPFFASLLNRSKVLDVSSRQKVLVPILTLYIVSMIVGMVFRPYYYSLFPYSFWTNL